MPLPPKYIALSLSEAYVTALEEKVAEYEYPLRTKETITVPLSVWDEHKKLIATMHSALERITKTYGSAAAVDIAEETLPMNFEPDSIPIVEWVAAMPEKKRIDELERQLQTLKDVPFDEDDVINYAYEIVELIEKGLSE